MSPGSQNVSPKTVKDIPTGNKIDDDPSHKSQMGGTAFDDGAQAADRARISTRSKCLGKARDRGKAAACRLRLDRTASAAGRSRSVGSSSSSVSHGLGQMPIVRLRTDRSAPFRDSARAHPRDPSPPRSAVAAPCGPRCSARLRAVAAANAQTLRGSSTRTRTDSLDDDVQRFLGEVLRRRSSGEKPQNAALQARWTRCFMSMRCL